MGRHDDLPYIVIERRSGGVTPFLWGALVGAAVALLYAPRSGRETQEELREGVERLRVATEGRIEEARDAATGMVDGVRQRVQDQVDTVRDAIESRVEGVRQAVDSGRQAAQNAREDLERRVAEAKDAANRDAEAERYPAGAAAPDVVITEVVVEEEPRRPEFG